MATVRKRTWQSGGETKTAWIVSYSDQHGSRHIKTFAKKKDADAWGVTAQSEVQRGIHTPERTSITVAEAAQLWLEKGELDRLERSTLRGYANNVKHHIEPLIGAQKLARLTTPAIEAYRDALLGKCSRAMARKALASLKSILGEAQRRGLVAQNAAQPVRVDIKGRDRSKLTVGRDVPSKEEINLILATAAAGRWRPLLITAIFTGMRSSEIRGLAWGEVDFERKVIHVARRADHWGTMGQPKSAAGDRDIPMGPSVVNTLREWRLACPRGDLDLVFPNGAGKVENHANILKRGWYPVQVEAGIVDGAGPKYGFHALRHFFASWAIEQGFSAKRLQGMLGHSSITMTFDTYGHLFPSLEDDHAKFAAGELALVGR